jgi:hypothetical protein
MIIRVCLSLALLTAIPAWSQALPTATGGTDIPDDDSRMQTPPPVNGEAYPTTVGSETRANYLAAALTLNTAYNDNVLGGGSTSPVGDVTYSIFPTLTIDQTTSRQHRMLTYSPGFTIYQHTSSLNEADQNAALNFKYLLTEHTAITLGDSFQKSSNVFNQSYPLSGGAISGSAQSPQIGVVAPFADRLTNTATAGLSYQFSKNSMIGGSGIATQLNYPNPAEASGLGDSSSRGGSAFYNQRLSSTQYMGVTYQYSASKSNPVNTQAISGTAQTGVQSHSISPFYTVYLSPTLSMSLSGGPAYIDATQSSSSRFRSWTYSAMASVGWQGSHTSFVASYSRAVAESVGLLGAFDANSANASARWQLARTWTVASAASYVINKNATIVDSSSSSGGHSVSGDVSIQHSMSENLRLDIGYLRLHQSYSGIAVISSAPDSNREYISVSYLFTRPLGR